MLRPKRLLPALLIAVAVPLLGAPAASAGTFTQCGDGQVNGSGWYNLKAKNVACNPARSLADHYVFEAGGNDDGFKRWRCDEEQLGDELWAVKCKREKADVIQRAKFKYGA